MCNTYPSREEVLSVVDNINDTFSDLTFKHHIDLDNTTVAIYHEAHGNMVIRVLGHNVWSAEDDDRPYDFDSTEEDARIDLKEYIYKELKTLVTGLSLLVRFKQ